MFIKKLIKYNNKIVSFKPNFFSKKIYKKYLRLKAFKLKHLKVSRNYLFKNRLYFFNTFKYKTSKRLIYGRHLYLLGLVASRLISKNNCFAFTQVAIKKKTEFPLLREFLYKNGLETFLFTKRNFKYMTLYNFPILYIKNLLAGGYSFVIHTFEGFLLLQFLLKKIYLNKFFLKDNSNINLNFLKINRLEFSSNPAELEFDFFKKINFLHLKFFETVIPYSFLEKFLVLFFLNPLFNNIKISSDINYCFQQIIFCVLNYYFRIRITNLMVSLKFNLNLF